MLKRNGGTRRGGGGEEDGKEGEKEKKIIKMKHTLIYAYILWLMFTQEHHRHSRQTFALSSKPSFHRENTGEWKDERVSSGRGDAGEGDVLFSTRKKKKMAADTIKDGMKTRPVCSSILIRPHESLTAVQLFILTQKPWFHHPSQGTKNGVCRIYFAKVLRVSYLTSGWTVSKT